VPGYPFSDTLVPCPFIRRPCILGFDVCSLTVHIPSPSPIFCSEVALASSAFIRTHYPFQKSTNSQLVTPNCGVGRYTTVPIARGVATANCKEIQTCRRTDGGYINAYNIYIQHIVDVRHETMTETTDARIETTLVEPPGTDPRNTKVPTYLPLLFFFFFPPPPAPPPVLPPPFSGSGVFGMDGVLAILLG